MHKLTHATYIRVPRAEKRVKKGKHTLQRHSRGKKVAFFLLEGYSGHQTSIIERDI